MSAWRKLALTVSLVALAAAYWIAWRAPAVGTFHDDGVYLVTAKALAEGKGYRIISLPNEIDQTKYPILFPMLLATVWKINPDFPNNVPALKLIPLIATLAWLWLSYKLLREEKADQTVAAWICLLSAASVWVIYLSAALLSEAVFGALTIAALLLLRRAERTQSQMQLIAAAAMAALAFHARSVGIAMIAAVPLYLMWRRQWRNAILFLAVAGLLAAPWVLWVASHGSAATPTDAYYSKENYKGWNIILNFAAEQKIHILLQNLMIVTFVPSMLLGIPATSLWILLAAVVGGVCTYGTIRQGANSITAFLAIYTTMILAWAWMPTRFVVPFFPLLLLYGWQRIEKRGRYAIAVPIILTAITAVNLVTSSAQTMAVGDPMPMLEKQDSWKSLEQLLEHARTHTPPNAVLAGNLDPLYYLYTGRKAIRGFAAEPYSLIYSQKGEPIGSAETVLRNMNRQGATHWLKSPNSTYLEGKYLSQFQSELTRKTPQGIARIPSSGDPTHSLYELHWDKIIRSQAKATSNP